MQVTIDLPNTITPIVQNLAHQSGKNESDIITSALLAYFLTPQTKNQQNFGQGWQQMYESLNDFEPNFVLERDSDTLQERQAMEF